MITRWLAVLSFVILLSGRARADTRCGAPADEWLRACASESRVAMKLVDCPAAVAVVELAPEAAAPFRVELSRKPGAFRVESGVGLSPIGDFPDWAKEPAERRAAFDALTACVKARSAAPLLGDDVDRSTAATRRRPWVLLSALVAAAAAVAFSRKARARRALVASGAALAAALVVFVARRALVPVQFFHQNGQGPLWIAFAAAGDAGSYGPGYPEIFQWLVSGAARADRALLLAQEIGAAFVPALVFSVARQVGARPAVAALLGTAVAVDPILSRLARSESYFATILTLLTAAATLLPLTADRGVRTPARVLAAIAAALFVAQAARVHPLAWVPAAPLPLIAFLAADRPRRGVSVLAWVTLTILAILAALVLPTMLAALRGRLGEEFMPAAIELARRRGPFALGAVALAAALFAVRRAQPAARPVFALAVALSAASMGNVLRNDAAMIDAAWLHGFVPVIAAAIAALSTATPSRASIALAPILLLHVLHDARSLSLPTDAAEQAFCLEWRERLPPGAQVAWLERAGARVLALPLDGHALPRAVRIQDDATPTLAKDGPRFWYRGSLCETPEGAPRCTAFERSHRLRPIESRTLPAVASLPWLPIGPSPITVQLYAIE
ncbi:MAG: hypothetical protein HYV09_22035 [Deltaproteobacteria bacterium]|nr:hypothetical protein [Deltaproteobacteria bacterium]